DVADGPADLDDDDLRLLLARHAMDPLLDLVGDVWDHLHGRAEVVAAALLGDDRVVDLAGREIRSTRHVAVDEPLVVSKIEVGLRAILGDEHLAVLDRSHRARVAVQTRIYLHRRTGER